jgi:hypothetical protein
MFDAGGAQGPHRHAVIGQVTRDDLEALGLTVKFEIIARDLEGALVGLRTARGIEDAGQMRRGHIDEFFGESDRRQIREPEKAGREGQPADLLAHRIADLGAAMADIDVPQACQAIDELPPLQILDIDTVPLDQDFWSLFAMGLQGCRGVQDVRQIIAIPLVPRWLHRCPSSGDSLLCARCTRPRPKILAFHGSPASRGSQQILGLA